MRNEDLTRFYQCQLQEFELAGKNYAELGPSICREISFGDFSLRIQHNPARILSTNAKIDADTLQQRKCFLCRENMPRQQKGIDYGHQYRIYVNPYPIFPAHFTVPSIAHTPQRIENRFPDLLNLTFEFPGWTTFYNGPACGASAPDHFHFQMAPRHAMPLEKDAGHEQMRRYILRKDYYSVACLNNYLREVLILQGSDLLLLTELFQQLREIIGWHIPYEQEPMMNLLAWFDNCQWTVCLFPRRTLRPWQFFAEGDKKVMFSPGSVDMAGLIIAPRKEDFSKYTAGLLTDLFQQVIPLQKDWKNILESIKSIKL